MASEIRGTGSPVFADRAEAGAELARHLDHLRGAVVLGIPRGGIVTADAVSWRLGGDLDVIVTRKLGAPGQPELAIGAVTADGVTFLNDGLIAVLGVSDHYLEAEIAAQRAAATRREALLRGVQKPLPLAGKKVIVVDDGVATGATMRAAIRSARGRGAAWVAAATPVGSVEACEELRLEADEVACPFELPHFGAVGSYYLRFEPVSDEEVARRLAAQEPAVTG